MLHIEIDGRKIHVEEGSMVIEAADAAGIYIPRFCYHKHLSVAANCRMCLVDVEKVAKPVPACATPVTEGMKVFTRSEKTINAQKGVMEFLLINHPLDCPICDQGGECELQDLAVGYGRDVSRFTEKKRIVRDQDLGPLIATDMTRCIHCTRCVRFGQEVAGIMELGATGRGEHMRIGTYIAGSVDSELSGNMIDLCPVGALTSKPFRYSARTWELQDQFSVSPHDCVGSNLNVQVLRGQVRRVLPAENDSVNEVWLSDRDRFSYAALDTDRLKTPRIRRDGRWVETDWATALEFVAKRLEDVIREQGADSLAGLAAPHATMEEAYLLQRLVRGLGSPHVDHRLRQRDFSDDAAAETWPGLGRPITDLETLDAVLLVGSNIRKEQPLLAHRLRQAVLAGARMAVVNPLDYPFVFDVHARSIGGPQRMLDALVAVLKEVNRQTGKPVPKGLEAWAKAVIPTAEEAEMARALIHGKQTAILLGAAAIAHPRYGDLRALADWLARAVGATLGYLPEANGAGAWLAGCVPHRGAGGAAEKAGLPAYDLLESARSAYLLLDTELELDAWSGGAAAKALEQAALVVVMTPFMGVGESYAHVQLPAAPFTETEGTLVNCEGRWQSFGAVASPLGDTRATWKILRALGGMLNVPGFDFTSLDAIRAKLAPLEQASVPQSHPHVPRGQLSEVSDLVHLFDVSPYRTDTLVRRAGPLQATQDNPPPALRLHPAEAERRGLRAGERVLASTGAAGTALPVVLDERVPEGCAVSPAGYRETMTLVPYAALHLERLS